jgi:hypothetical protein
MGRRLRLLVPESRVRSAARSDEAEVALAPFDAAARAEFWWRQPKRFRRAWVLEADGRAVAAMKGEPVFSQTSRVRFSDAAYVMRRGWTGNAEVRAEDAAEPLVRLRAGFWTSRVLTSSDETLKFVPIGLFQRAHELRTEEGHVLVRFESHEGFARHEVQVLIEDSARGRDDLRPLLGLVAAIVFAPKRHSS